MHMHLQFSMGERPQVCQQPLPRCKICKSSPFSQVNSRSHPRTAATQSWSPVSDLALWTSLDCHQDLDSVVPACDPAAFTSYLQQYQNTVCGRHPTSVLLQTAVTGPSKELLDNAAWVLRYKIVSHFSGRYQMEFQCCDQSSKAASSSGSSVTYEAAVVSES